MALIERIGRAFSSLSGSRPNTPTSWPKHVGILALEVYFPNTKVDQAELELHDGVAKGKYTLGLGQTSMAFAGDNEDVVSMALTVVSELLRKYDVAHDDIGRMEVGTESSIDRSKSIKSHLMRLFKDTNTNIQGVDCVSACFGATAALLNAVNWIESKSWDGRYALVVASDLAVYARGPARPSGGCGAVAMLIGPDAPLVVETDRLGTYMEDTYDFYKPSGMYPQVDGRLSIDCYLRAMDRCYSAFYTSSQNRRRTTTGFSVPERSLEDFDFCIMHAPFNKMVRKGFSQLMLSHVLSSPAGSTHNLPSQHNDADSPGWQTEPSRASGAEGAAEAPHADAGWQGSVGEEAIRDALRSLKEREVMPSATSPEIMAATEADFERMVRPGLLLGSQCGNMYTASLYAGLASLVYSQAEMLAGSRILAYSYGSGLAASIFGIRAAKCQGRFGLANIARQLDLEDRLARRWAVAPENYVAMLQKIEDEYGKANLKTQTATDGLQAGSYYLVGISDTYQRSYSKAA